jgi:hypothetical protein
VQLLPPEDEDGIPVPPEAEGGDKA